MEADPDQKRRLQTLGPMSPHSLHVFFVDLSEVDEAVLPDMVSSHSWNAARLATHTHTHTKSREGFTPGNGARYHSLESFTLPSHHILVSYISHTAPGISFFCGSVCACSRFHVELIRTARPAVAAYIWAVISVE